MFDLLYCLFQRSSTVLSIIYLLCMGVCGGEGAERAAGGGVQDVPSPSDVGPEPLRTEPSRSANLVVAEFRMGGREEHGRTLMAWWPLRWKTKPHRCWREHRTKVMLGNVWQTKTQIVMEQCCVAMPRAPMRTRLWVILQTCCIGRQGASRNTTKPLAVI